MANLINVNYENERPTVLGRDLHEFLEVNTPYHKWITRMIEYGFNENQDYLTMDKKVHRLDGAEMPQTQTDHQLTIEMAKEIAMLQRNEKGKQARQYFIQLEKDWNSPEKVMARALRIANEKLNLLSTENAQQKQIIAEYSPKASYYDVVLQTTDILSATQISKDYGKSAKWLNEILHELGVQYKQAGVWLLYQKFAEMGYTKSKTHTYSSDDGEQHSKIHTYWTQKGRLFIYDLLKIMAFYLLWKKQHRFYELESRWRIWNESKRQSAS